MGGPEPAHLSFSYTKHQLCVCVGGGWITEERAFKGHKALWLRNPSSPKCPHPEQMLPCVLSKEEVKGMGCAACPGLHSVPGPPYALCMASWQMTTPSYPSLHAWHQLMFHTVSLCTETTGPHHDFSLSGEQREKWKDTTNYFLPFLSDLSLRVLFTYKCFLCTPLWPFKASLSLILPNVM